MHVHCAGFLLGLLLVAAAIFGLWQVLGWWLVYVPLALIGLAMVARVSPRLVRAGRAWQQRRLDAPRLAALKLKRQIAASEAALGVPLPMDGTCPVCQAPRVAGASFCTQCRTALTASGAVRSRPAIMCPRCAERQPDGSRFCWACGARLAVSGPAAGAGYAGSGVEASEGGHSRSLR
jgi:hypothetical protein